MYKTQTYLCLALLSLVALATTANAVSISSRDSSQSRDLINSGVQKLAQVHSRLGTDETDTYDIYAILEHIDLLYNDYTFCDAVCEDGMDKLTAYEDGLNDWVDSIDNTVADQNMVIINMLTPIYESFEETLDELDIELSEKDDLVTDFTTEFNQDQEHYMEITDCLNIVNDLIDTIVQSLVDYVGGETQNAVESAGSYVQVDLSVTRDFFTPKIASVQQKLLELTSKSDVTLLHDTINMLQDIDEIDWEEDTDVLIVLLGEISGNLAQVISYYQTLEAQIQENYNTMSTLLEKNIEDIRFDMDTINQSYELVEDEMDLFEESIELYLETMEDMTVSMNSITDFFETLLITEDNTEFELECGFDLLDSTNDALEGDPDVESYVYDLFYA